VLSEQVRVVGLAVRREALVLAGVLVFVSGMLLLDLEESGGRVDFAPLPPIILLALGGLAPFAIWKGERIFGDAHLWTLPFDRRPHAFAKVIAGALWLLAAVAGMYAWLLLLALVTGGSIGETETRMLAGLGGVKDLTPVNWSTPAWQWATPFTTVLLGYLFGSTLLLGFRRPLLWLAGAVAAFFAIVALDEADVANGFAHAFFDTVIAGGYGLETAVGLGDSQEMDGVPPNPGAHTSVLVVHYILPSLQRTAPALLLWTACGLIALWIAAWRHRER
jgi:hypothetical protein